MVEDPWLGCAPIPTPARGRIRSPSIKHPGLGADAVSNLQGKVHWTSWFGGFRSLVRVCGLGSGWISVGLCGLLWFKRFRNHGRPQSYAEGFDGWFDLPYHVRNRLANHGSKAERLTLPHNFFNRGMFRLCEVVRLAEKNHVAVVQKRHPVSRTHDRRQVMTHE